MTMHRILKSFFLPLFLVAVAFAWGCQTNPVTGRQELRLVTPQQELQLGRDYHPSLVMMYDGEYVGDDELTRYLTAVVDRVHSVSHRREMPVSFTLLNTSVVNAFALPGHVYATRGLVVRLDSEAEFASIMAHEMGHVAAGHTAQRLTRQALTTLALGLGGYALEDAEGIMLAGQVGIMLAGLSYSREQERQADRLAVYYMTLAGWNPEAALEVHRMLGELSGREETILDKYLATHPPPAERIDYVTRMIDSGELPLERVEGDGLFAGRWADRTDNIRRVQQAYEKYDEAAQKLRSEETEKALALVGEAVDIQPDQAPFHRLKGDVLLRKDRLDGAETAYKRSLELYPGYSHAHIGLGKLALASGNYAEAESSFLEASGIYPASLAAQHGLGVARYEQEKFHEAVEPLKTVSDAVPQNPRILFMLARSYDNSEQLAPAYETYVRAVNSGLEEPERSFALERIQALE